MPRGKDFYRRFILSCFSRTSAPALTVKQISRDAQFAIGREGLSDMWTTLEEMVDEGYLDYNPLKQVYLIKSYRLKPSNID